MSISFIIPGRLPGKGRARSTLIRPKNKPAFISNYTPAETRNAESMVRGFGHEAMEGCPPLDGPLWLSIETRIMPPASWSNRKRQAATFVTGKPDLDNVLKLIGDALNGICWRDDSQIAAINFIRLYKAAGPEQTTVSFGGLVSETVPAPTWREKALPLFEGLQA